MKRVSILEHYPAVHHRLSPVRTPLPPTTGIHRSMKLIMQAAEAKSWHWNWSHDSFWKLDLRSPQFPDLPEWIPQRFFVLQIVGFPLKQRPVHLISRACVLSPGCRGRGGQSVSINLPSRMGGELPSQGGRFQMLDSLHFGLFCKNLLCVILRKPLWGFPLAPKFYEKSIH